MRAYSFFKKLVLSSLILVFTLTLQAQTIERITFSSGVSASNSFKSSIGSPYGANLSEVNGSLTISAEYGETTFIENGMMTISNSKENEINIKVYPNPSMAHINIEIINSNLQFPINLSLYDLKGVLIKSYETNTSFSKLNMSELGEGTYILRLTSDKIIIRTFNIIKTF